MIPIHACMHCSRLDMWKLAFFSVHCIVCLVNANSSVTFIVLGNGFIAVISSIKLETRILLKRLLYGHHAWITCKHVQCLWLWKTIFLKYLLFEMEVDVAHNTFYFCNSYQLWVIFYTFFNLVDNWRWLEEILTSKMILIIRRLRIVTIKCEFFYCAILIL